jgi:hypothetical protein
MPRGQPLAQCAEPDDLALVELASDRAPVRDVGARHRDAAALRGEQAGVAFIGIVETVAEAEGRIVDADARQDRDAVPLPLAVVHRFVAECAELQLRKGLVGEFGLLQTEHVDVGVAEELLDTRDAGLQRVDVPGGDTHAGRRLRRTPPRDREADLRVGAGAVRSWEQGRATPATGTTPTTIEDHAGVDDNRGPGSVNSGPGSIGSGDSGSGGGSSGSGHGRDD